MIRDLVNNATFTKLADPTVLTADTNSSSIDMQGYQDLTLVFSVGESGDTLSGSVYIELEVEESSDNSTWTDCADADLSATVTGTNTGTAAKIDDAAEDDVIVAVQYHGNKRYVRGVVNLTGTHASGTPIGILAIQTGKEEL